MKAKVGSFCIYLISKSKLPCFFFPGEGSLLFWQNSQLAANECVREAVAVLVGVVGVQLLRDVVRADRLRVGKRGLEDVNGGVGEAELGDGVEVEALTTHVKAAGGAVEDVLLAELGLSSNRLVYLGSSYHTVVPGNES